MASARARRSDRPTRQRDRRRREPALARRHQPRYRGGGPRRSGSMTRATLALTLFTALTASACAGDDPTDDTGVTLRTGEFTVPIGDSFTCFYLEKHTDREISVNGAFGD